MLKWWLEDICTLQELQACLLTMVIIPHIICIENWEELPPEGRGNNHMILSCKLAICMGSLVTRVYRHDVHMVAWHSDTYECERCTSGPQQNRKIGMIGTHTKLATHEYRHPFWLQQPHCVCKHPYKNKHPTNKHPLQCKWKWICWVSFSNVAANFRLFLCVTGHTLYGTKANGGRTKRKMDEKQTSETEKDIDSMKGKAEDESKEEEPNRKRKKRRVPIQPSKRRTWQNTSLPSRSKDIDPNKSTVN